MKRSLPVLMLWMGLIAAGCGSASPTEEAPPPAAPMTAVTLTAEQIARGGVQWSAVSATPVSDSVELPGRLVPDDDHAARLSASVRGRVVSVHANLGDTVTRGQLLVVLQSEEASARKADLTRASAELTERQSALRYARAARERAERLLALKAASAQDLERARTDETAAEAGVAQSQASVDQARASLANLEVDDATGQIHLKSPITGLVVTRDAVVGAVTETGAPALTVMDPAHLWLEFGASDALARIVAPGQRVRFTVAAGGPGSDARVLRVSGAVDPATRLITVRAAVDNPAMRLRPETFVTVRVATTPLRPGITLLHDAVQLLDERPVVFVAEPDGKGGARFLRRAVTIGTTVDGRTHIVTGLSAGDVVVTGGAFAIKSLFSRGKMPAGE